jgi:hypothetical protein
MLTNTISNTFRSSARGRALTLASRILMSALLAAPIYADCLPSVPDGWHVPYYMSTHNVITNAVGYSTGSLVNSSATVPFISGDDFPQLFSDRVTTCSPEPSFLCSQPFNAYAADHVGVTITRPAVRGTLNTTISVTLTLDTWGNTKYTFPAVCDATTGLLYGSLNNNTMAVFSFGAPEPQSPAQ